MRRTLYFMVLAVLISSAHATEFEKTVKELPVVVEENNTEQCTTYSFPMFETRGEEFFLFSLNAEFLPAREGSFEIRAMLNGEEIEKISDFKEFSCNENDCWARIFLEKGKIMEQNGLEICARTDKAITNIVLKDSSTIGAYTMPLFLKKEFIQAADNLKPVVGETVSVIVTLKNLGSEKACDASVVYVRQIVEEIGERVEVIPIGNTEFNSNERGACINPIEIGEVITLKYKLKVKKAGFFTLPPAALYYKNSFGEEKLLFSNVVKLEAIEQQIKPEILAEKVFFVGENAKIAVAVKNEFEERVEELQIFLVNEDGLEIIGSRSKAIKAIEGKQIEKVEFAVTAIEPGSYAVGCIVAMGTFEKSCGNVSISFKSRDIDPVALGAILFLLGGIMIYLYIYYKKD